MGRPYAEELRELDSTYEWARDAEIRELARFVRSSVGVPMVSVGSGGSLTNAIFASILHQNAGSMAYHATPLEFIQLEISLRNTAVLLVTAGGRNSDIIAAFGAAVEGESRRIMILYGSPRSPVPRIVSRYGFVDSCRLSPPSGKRDGFIAVNSLLAFAVALHRAYSQSHCLYPELPESLHSLAHPNRSRAEFMEQMEQRISPLLDRDTLAVLYGKWGKAPAFDLESKFTEAALCNVQLADYRNFAHGRHHWLAKRGDRTGVIAFITPDCKTIAKKTLASIPKDIPQMQLSSEHSSSIAALDLMVREMYLVGLFGRARGLDPGRPSVPTFGSRIYRLKPPRRSKSPDRRKLTAQEMVAVSRKMDAWGTVHGDDAPLEFWAKAHRTFVGSLERTCFGSIVLDYDGTLCNPESRNECIPNDLVSELTRLLRRKVLIGVCTGRGKSVRAALREVLPLPLWERVLVGYYNGSDIGWLNDDEYPDRFREIDPAIETFSSLMGQHGYVRMVASYECRPSQISFRPENPSRLESLLNLLHVLAERWGTKDLQILRSSHSIDVLPRGVSKTDLVRAAKEYTSEHGKPEPTLCIGDRGNWPGNDYALLSGPYSLSTDMVSPDPSSCWNLAAPGHRYEQATLEYLRAIRAGYGVMTFRGRRRSNER